MAIGQNSPMDLVVDDGDVFWVNNGDPWGEQGQVVQLAPQDTDTSFSDEEVGYIYRIAR